MEIKKERNSSLEALKLLAIIFIVFSHCAPVPTGIDGDYTINFNYATDNIQILIIAIIKSFGHIGNGIFIICSSWFLTESKKADLKKVMYFLSDQMIISVLYLIVFLAAGFDIATRHFVQQLFPVTYRLNWFVVCYLLYYVIHPALNIVIEKLNQKMHLGICVTMLLFYGCINLAVKGSFHYTELIGFICYYFIITYMKKYMDEFRKSSKANIILLITGFIGLIGLILMTNFLGLRMDSFSDKLLRWSVFINPFIICISIGFFNLANKKHFVSKPINYVSGLSLLIYMLHNNRLIVVYFAAYFFNYVYTVHTYDKILLWVILYGLILLIGGTLLAVIYHETIQKLVKKCCDKLYPELNKGFNRILDKLIKIK